LRVARRPGRRPHPQLPRSIQRSPRRTLPGGRVHAPGPPTAPPQTIGSPASTVDPRASGRRSTLGGPSGLSHLSNGGRTSSRRRSWKAVIATSSRSSPDDGSEAGWCRRGRPSNSGPLPAERFQPSPTRTSTRVNQPIVRGRAPGFKTLEGPSTPPRGARGTRRCPLTTRPSVRGDDVLTSTGRPSEDLPALAFCGLLPAPGPFEEWEHLWGKNTHGREVMGVRLDMGWVLEGRKGGSSAGCCPTIGLMCPSRRRPAVRRGCPTRLAVDPGFRWGTALPGRHCPYLKQKEGRRTPLLSTPAGPGRPSALFGRALKFSPDALPCALTSRSFLGSSTRGAFRAGRSPSSLRMKLPWGPRAPRATWSLPAPWVRAGTMIRGGRRRGPSGPSPNPGRRPRRGGPGRISTTLLAEKGSANRPAVSWSSSAAPRGAPAGGSGGARDPGPVSKFRLLLPGGARSGSDIPSWTAPFRPTGLVIRRCSPTWFVEGERRPRRPTPLLSASPRPGRRGRGRGPRSPRACPGRFRARTGRLQSLTTRKGSSSDESLSFTGTSSPGNSTRRTRLRGRGMRGTTRGERTAGRRPLEATRSWD